MASQFPGDTPSPIAPPPATSGFVARIQRLITQPKAEWTLIDAEPTTAAQVFQRWAVPLAAIPPVAMFIGMQIFGWNFFGIHYRPSLVGSLVQAVLQYGLALLGVWVLAQVIDALAPNFGAVKNRNQAMKVAAYSYTAAWVAGVLNILPALSPIAALVSLYSFYLLWVGLPILMRPPADKAVGYVVVSIVVSIVLYVVVSSVVGLATASLVRPAYTGGTVTLGSVSTGDGTSVNLDRLAAASTQIAANAERTAQAVQTQAQNGAATAGIADPAKLQAMLPASVAGFTRTAVETAGGGAGGLGAASATGTYTQGDQRFELSVSDVGALGSLATLGGALNVNTSKQTATGYERTAMQNGNMVSEEWDGAGKRGKYSTVVASRFAVTAEGTAPSIDPLKAAVAAVDQSQLAALAR